MSTENEDILGLSPQMLRIGSIFLALSTVLALAYFAFLREDYAVLYEDLRLEQAAAVVEQLDAQNIPHRLRENGTQILVAQSRTGEARLSIAGSEVGRGGLSGFELFDDSDMGLTDFAQKIKYQRALQGELARTILQQEGVDEARVHISMPERTLFRGDSNPANAAVSILPSAGVVLSESRIEGIQRLVAAAVPELDYRDVVVLGRNGEVISRSIADDFALTALQIAPGETPPADPDAIARARSLIAPVLAGLAFDVTIDTPVNAAESATSTAEGSEEAAIDVLGRVRVLTEIPLSDDQQARITALLSEGGQFGAVRISGIGFEDAIPSQARIEARAAMSRPVSDSSTFAQRADGAVVPATMLTPDQAARLARSQPGMGNWIGAVLWVLVLIAALVAAALLVWRKATEPSLSEADHQKLADRLRAELAALDTEGEANAV